jgi:hypothetical protein
MTAGTPISDEADGIGAPGMWPTCLSGPGMAANRPAIDRICLRTTVRRKQVAYDTDPKHNIRVWKASRGKSRFDGLS